MTRAQLSVYMFGLYLISGICLPLLIIPDFALGMFGISAGDGMWVRYVGVLAGVIGAFYIAAVLTRTDIMLGWTVPARYVTATFLCAMVVLGKVGLALLLFAAFDALTASITWIAIKADAEDEASA
ncbi:MAG: hypothetical protein AAGF14_02355 [Pseudomonadota bacterium]